MRRNIELFPATHKLAPVRHYNLAAPTIYAEAGEREISWLGRAPSGEDQVYSGPCGIYATASVIEASRRSRIPDSERREAYRIALRNTGGKDGDGLTYPDCVRAAVEIGWLPAGATAEPADAEMILVRPLLGAYRVNGSIDNASADGVLDHSDGAVRSQTRGYHAMTVLSYGWVGKDPKARWCGENSWKGWGSNGLWSCYDVLHREICYELWYIKGCEVVA
jgi:hypothetical protein